MELQGMENIISETSNVLDGIHSKSVVSKLVNRKPYQKRQFNWSPETNKNFFLPSSILKPQNKRSPRELQKDYNACTESPQRQQKARYGQKKYLNKKLKHTTQSNYLNLVIKGKYTLKRFIH